ncbi:hypothetical protein MJO28_009675 [Puccinia striiformis f. sp. tritici]|uniref:Uncharacterized protein n=1 Tax=Puccinia striiformis f. sp. tritici TaxID=168172 RepID=A0ACC0E987_9BASI|nr:hypothetical protein MJO28_009675 [Puccinia striiformis f. sp. tritici]
MGQPRKRPRRGLPSSVDDPKGRPAKSDQQEEDDETQSAAQTPTSTAASLEQTDEARLEHALRKYHNNSSAAYTSYHPTELSNQKDKFKQFCIAWKCKTCKLNLVDLADVEKFYKNGDYTGLISNDAKRLTGVKMIPLSRPKMPSGKH